MSAFSGPQHLTGENRRTHKARKRAEAEERQAKYAAKQQRPVRVRVDLKEQP